MRLRKAALCECLQGAVRRHDIMSTATLALAQAQTIWDIWQKGNEKMEEKEGIMGRIKDIINGTTDAERARKAGMQGNIDQADHIFQFLLLLFGLGFWVVMILKMFL